MKDSEYIKIWIEENGLGEVLSTIKSEAGSSNPMSAFQKNYLINIIKKRGFKYVLNQIVKNIR